MIQEAIEELAFILTPELKSYSRHNLCQWKLLVISAMTTNTNLLIMITNVIPFTLHRCVINILCFDLTTTSTTSAPSRDLLKRIPRSDSSTSMRVTKQSSDFTRKKGCRLYTQLSLIWSSSYAEMGGRPLSHFTNSLCIWRSRGFK